MGALARLIGHHPSGLTIAVELAIVGLLALVFGGIWLRERRRRRGSDRHVAELRDE